MVAPDLYELLQVSRKADPEVIQAAYRKLSLKYHPDRNSCEDAKEKMQQLNSAYEVLSDPESRKQYDAQQASESSAQRAAGRGKREGKQDKRYSHQASLPDWDGTGRCSECGLVMNMMFVDACCPRCTNKMGYAEAFHSCASFEGALPQDVRSELDIGG